MTVKVCTKCDETKEMSEFYDNAQTKSGKQSWCKACVCFTNRERQGLKRAEKAELKALMKDGPLARMCEVQELKTRTLAKLRAIAVKYSVATDTIVREFGLGFRGVQNAA